MTLPLVLACVSYSFTGTLDIWQHIFFLRVKFRARENKKWTKKHNFQPTSLSDFLLPFGDHMQKFVARLLLRGASKLTMPPNDSKRLDRPIVDRPTFGTFWDFCDQHCSFCYSRLDILGKMITFSSKTDVAPWHLRA